MPAAAKYRQEFESLTSVNVGAINSASSGKVYPEEGGDAFRHSTLLSFAALPVVTGNTTGASFGSKQIYDWPQCQLWIQSIVAIFTTITFNTEAGATGDIDGAGSGDYSMGTTATADATLSTTDVDLLPSTAMLDPFVTGVGRSNVGSALAAGVKFDGTGTAKSLFLNVIIDDADVADAAAADSVYFTGWARISWIWLGDY